MIYLNSLDDRKSSRETITSGRSLVGPILVVVGIIAALALLWFAIYKVFLQN